jgi:hypothetical protein
VVCFTPQLEESPLEDLHLERLEFIQQLFELEEASPILHRQRLEVDFIRPIEEKQQENQEDIRDWPCLSPRFS